MLSSNTRSSLRRKVRRSDGIVDGMVMSDTERPVPIGTDGNRWNDRTTMLVEEHVRVMRHVEPFVETQLALLRPVNDGWQPSDVLPCLTGDSWSEEIQRLRELARCLPDEILVVLVGDTVTEEALPSYQTMFNRHLGLADDTGASDAPWARWSRGWTAEETRHGKLLSTYLYLSGRVDVRAVEVTIQHLVRNGFDPLTSNDPYRGLVYTAFQERATKLSHGNTARLAVKSGEPVLGRMCNLIAGDEARHEEAYKRFMGKILETDPSGAVMAIAQMMRTRIVMPGSRMTDGTEGRLFEQFAIVAQRIGAYTVRDYAQIIEHLVDYWHLQQLTGLTDEAAEAQDYLCGLPERCLKHAQRIADTLAKQSRIPCRWIFDRMV